jgi:hypothetical protein
VHRPISGLTGISDLDRQAAEIIRQGPKDLILKIELFFSVVFTLFKYYEASYASENTLLTPFLKLTAEFIKF